MDEHLGCFHVLTIVNSTAMNIEVHASFWIIILSGYVPRSGIAGSYTVIPSLDTWLGLAWIRRVAQLRCTGSKHTSLQVIEVVCSSVMQHCFTQEETCGQWMNREFKSLRGVQTVPIPISYLDILSLDHCEAVHRGSPLQDQYQQKGDWRVLRQVPM